MRLPWKPSLSADPFQHPGKTRGRHRRAALIDEKMPANRGPAGAMPGARRQSRVGRGFARAHRRCHRAFRLNVTGSIQSRTGFKCGTGRRLFCLRCVHGAANRRGGYTSPRASPRASHCIGAVVRRRRWSRQVGNDGVVRVLVSLTEARNLKEGTASAPAPDSTRYGSGQARSMNAGGLTMRLAPSASRRAKRPHCESNWTSGESGHCSNGCAGR
jgi:hypothetical protein